MAASSLKCTISYDAFDLNAFLLMTIRTVVIQILFIIVASLSLSVGQMLQFD